MNKLATTISCEFRDTSSQSTRPNEIWQCTEKSHHRCSNNLSHSSLAVLVSILGRFKFSPSHISLIHKSFKFSFLLFSVEYEILCGFFMMLLALDYFIDLRLYSNTILSHSCIQMRSFEDFFYKSRPVDERVRKEIWNEVRMFIMKYFIYGSEMWFDYVRYCLNNPDILKFLTGDFLFSFG